MCELIQFIRVLIFVVCAVMIVGGVILAFHFCKRRGIDMNTFSGMFEMYRRVFTFESKAFSIAILVCMYGSVALILTVFALTAWGVGHGCEFPLARNQAR